MTDSQMAWAGVRYFLLMRAHRSLRGIPLSREKANIIREKEVTEERPQNHMARVISHRSVCPNTPPKAWLMTWMKGLSAATAAPTSLMASVTKASMIIPVTKEKATEVKIPQGARTRGWRVSSIVWAEASYPVKVH